MAGWQEGRREKERVWEERGESRGMSERGKEPVREKTSRDHGKESAESRRGRQLHAGSVARKCRARTECSSGFFVVFDFGARRHLPPSTPRIRGSSDGRRSVCCVHVWHRSKILWVKVARELVVCAKMDVIRSARCLEGTACMSEAPQGRG
eukprot:1593181-Rhodomonas_salina.1